MKPLLALLVLAALPLAAQVSVQFAPEPMEVTKALGIQSRLGLWRVAMCNDSSTNVTVAPERVYMAAGTLSIVSPTRAAI
jgi:hypothetical protein